MIRDLGSPNAYRQWQLHAGRCPEHGWFQAEVVGRPPREIFPVTKPFGAARRMIVNGEEVYQFPTIWNDVPEKVRLSPVDPLEAKFWEPKPIS